MDIVEIFKKGIDQSDKRIINNIPIDWVYHSRGVMNLIKAHEPNFIISEANKELLKKMLAYYTGDVLFEKYKVGSLNKGILLTGSVGSGKSLLLEKIFKIYTSEIIKNNSFHSVNFKDLTESYKIEGDRAFSEIQEIKDNSKTVSRIITKPFLIDDLGAGEYEVGNYGNKINMIDKIIDIRYRIYTNHRKLTHVTTNLYISDLKKICDDRTISRIAEMFNVIELQDIDYRKE